MSYLTFCPTFSMAGSARIGRRAAERRRLVEPSRSLRPADRQVIGLALLPARTTGPPARPGAGRARWSRCRCRTWAAAAARRGTRRTTPGCRPAGSRRPTAARPRAAAAAGGPSSSRNPWKPHSMQRASRASRSGGWVLRASQSSSSGRSSRRVTSCRARRAVSA